MIMKKIFMTFLICNLGLCMFAQSNIPFVSFTPVYADPVHVSPPSVNTNYDALDPLGLGTNLPRVNTKQKNDAIWFNAVAVSSLSNGQQSDWYNCDFRVSLDESMVKVYAKTTMTFKSVMKEEIYSDEDGNIYLSRQCVDQEGVRCALDLVQSPSKSIILFIGYSNYTICYGLIPD